MQHTPLNKSRHPVMEALGQYFEQPELSLQNPKHRCPCISRAPRPALSPCPQVIHNRVKSISEIFCIKTTHSFYLIFSNPMSKNTRSVLLYAADIPINTTFPLYSHIWLLFQPLQICTLQNEIGHTENQSYFIVLLMYRQQLGLRNGVLHHLVAPHFFVGFVKIKRIDSS